MALSKKFIRALSYTLASLAFIGVFFVIRHNKLSTVPVVLDQNIFSTEEYQEFITDVKFKKCPRNSVGSCSIKDKDSASSLNIKWIRVRKNLFLKDGSKWDFGFNDYYMFIKTVNFPELTKDQFLTNNFYRKKRFVDQIAVYDAAHDAFAENKDMLPARVIRDYSHKAESFGDMILSGFKYISGNSVDNSDLTRLTIPTLKQVTEMGWRPVGHGLWIKTSNFDPQNTLQRLDILFGEDAVDPRADWFLIKKPLQISGQQYPAYITLQNPSLVHKASTMKPPTLKIHPDGTFKILQVADLHFSTGVGVCRDPVPKESANGCQADPRTLKFINEVIDVEKPDLVVLTGDQVFGETSPDSLSTALKAYAPFIAKKIPFAVTLGNHDDEGSLGRWEVMEIAHRLPYSLAVDGPEKVAGVGNYLVTVQGPKSSNPAMSLWFLDTHKYSPNPKTNPGYDWLKDSQLDWLEEKYEDLKPSIAKYSHIHLSMAFFHIPIPEFRNFGENNVVGSYKEAVTASTYNTGVRTVFAKMGVSVASVGHDHCNDYCLHDTHKESKMDHGMWLCYGGASGEGGYGGYGETARRVRLFSIDTNKNRITSWKRVETAPEIIIDNQVLVDGGKSRSPGN